VPIVEIEHHGIGAGFCPAVLAHHSCRADHELSLFDAFFSTADKSTQSAST
jgi:hypothetical protein